MKKNKDDKWFINLYYNMISYLKFFNPKRLFYKTTLLYQQITRGWSDEEVWNMDDSFFKWTLPRLKRFVRLTTGYPLSYKTFEEWKNELNKRIKQLELLNEYLYCEYDFPHTEYYNQNILMKQYNVSKEKAEKMFKDNPNVYAYDCCLYDFMIWYGKNIRNLWY